jgi:hypothetical protein
VIAVAASPVVDIPAADAPPAVVPVDCRRAAIAVASGEWTEAVEREPSAVRRRRADGQAPRAPETAESQGRQPALPVEHFALCPGFSSLCLFFLII